MSNFAFFDVDGTVLTFKSMFSFQDFYLTRGAPARPALGWLRRTAFNARIQAYERAGKPREFINQAYYRSFRGHAVADVSRAVGEWWADVTARVAQPYCSEVVRELRRHQAEGTQAVFVSGSSHTILAPLAAELGVRHLLATRPVAVDGRYTGAIEPPQTIGVGKATAIRRFLCEQGADPMACHGYGDHHSDIAMLEAVGRPCAVAGDPELERYARFRGWRILQPDGKPSAEIGAHGQLHDISGHSTDRSAPVPSQRSLSRRP